MYFDDLHDRRQKIHQEEKNLEAQRLQNFNESVRIARNQMYFNRYRDMELYEFQQKMLTIQRDKRIQVGTNVDLYT
jgi:hypothetical protein